MALIRSLNTAVSGLRAQQFRIETVGNNIANVDTTAFKTTRVDFSTLLNQSITYGMAPQGFLGGIDPVQIGLGSQVAGTTSDFSQGPTEATGVASDLAIQGNGFFVLKDSAGGRVFTRDGSFSINPANLLHDAATGFVVQGHMADENFQVTPGGVVEDISIPVGSMTIARATTFVNLQGNLNPSGLVGGQGSLHLSDILYDDRFTNSDLISSENPVGLERATADTPLANLVRSLGDFVPYSGTAAGTAGTATMVFPQLAEQPTGVGITLSAQKGERVLPDATFLVGDPPPTGGTTLGDFLSFLRRSFGVNDGVWDGGEQTEHTYSYTRTDPFTGEDINGIISATNGVDPDDEASLSSITDHQSNFRNVRVGDYVRFTSGAASGQIAEITMISASTPGGTLDTLTFRTDGFNSLTVAPVFGDSYVVQAPAGVRLASAQEMLEIDGSSPSVTVGAPATTGGIRSFTVTDMAVTNFATEHGLLTNHRVEYLSGGATVTGWITAVADDTISISYSSALAQDPDAGTTFSISESADGSIEVASNAGTVNGLSDLVVISGGSQIPLFSSPVVAPASGESISMVTTVYDSLGAPRQVQLSFVFEGSSANGPNTWRYFAESLDDSDQDPVVGSGTIVFGAKGQYLTTGELSEVVTIDLDATPTTGGGVETPFSLELDFSRMTQFSTTMSEVQLQAQDGFESGVLREFAVSDDGTITGVFSNGLARTLGQVVLARFANPNGLKAEGGNMYRSSVNSGDSQIGIPGSFGRGTVRSGVLEESNVDLALQFTDLIIGQRAYQANARTITVSDQMLQELVNLI